MTPRLSPARLLVLLLVVVSASTPAPPSHGAARKDPAVSSLLLFAGTPGGLWRSRNWGNDWERVEKLVGLGAARFVLPIGPWVYVGGEGGLFFSEDFGETWTHPYTGAAPICGVSSRYPQADPTMFLGTTDGLLRSTDAGSTFQKTGLTGTPVHRLEWPGPTLIVGTGRGVAVSDDGGEHFRQPGQGLPVGEVRALALSSFYPVDPVMFAGVGTEGVFRSPDGGRTWSAAGLAGFRINDLVWFGPLLYAATGSGLYRSDDSGRNWAPLGQGLGKAVPLRLLFPLFPESGSEVFLATDRGIFSSADGGAHWLATDFPASGVLCLSTFPALERTKKR